MLFLKTVSFKYTLKLSKSIIPVEIEFNACIVVEEINIYI
jgi:hypothetical protein